jgi:MoaA/NifB/PqqE/SkfB family radical SAM enzyme
LGNVCDQSLWEVWTGSIVSDYRKHLSASNRRFSPCVNCDVRGDLIGNAHRQMFEVLSS